MKVPLSWLADFIDLPTRDPDAIELALAQLGHEVEEIVHLAPTFEGVVVGRVDEVGPHPNADRIRFCKVDDGAEVHEVVCGAWNFEAGAIIAYAKVGARLGLDTETPFELTAKELRGVTSHGMIASARELGLGDDHDGILVLDRLGIAGADDLGRDFAELLPYPDIVFDVSITANRGDCMSILGLARDLAAFWDIPVREPQSEPTTSGDPTAFRVDIEDAQACPRFVAREVEDVTIGPSPLWMQLRLAAAGQRPISNVVDVSNYVMLEIGHPIHTFDGDTIADQHLVIRRAADGERLTTLDGQDRGLLPSDIVVTDASGVIALAGVMGGATTEVVDTTTRILIEAAHWDPPSILLTSHRLGLRSEASARFERGVDPNLSALATARVAELIAETAGGVVRPGVVDTYPTPIDPWPVRLDAHDVARLLGSVPDLATGAGYLRRLGFTVEEAGEDAVTVTVPTRRRDITRPADLVEEIARMHGYDNFADRLRTGARGALSPEQRAIRRLRETLVGAGYSEAQTLSFLGQGDLDRLRLADGDERRVGIKVTNPLREEEGTLRTTLIPGLLKAVSTNLGRGGADVALFETGRVFLTAPDGEDPRIPKQPVMLGFAAHGRLGSAGLNGNARPVDVFTATGVIELLAETFGRDLAVRQAQLPILHPGRGAEVVLDGEVVGFAGELHPAIGRDLGVEGRVAIGELAVAKLLSAVADWQLAPVSGFPPTQFDLAFTLDEAVAAGDLVATVRNAAGPDLESLHVFDEFRGPSLGEGRKSLALRLTLRSSDHTFTDEEMVPVRAAIIAAVAERHGGALRGGS